MKKGPKPLQAEPLQVEVEVDSEIRLDAFLAERLDLSRNRVASLVDDGRVLLRGQPVRKSYRPRAGDELHVDLPPPPDLSIEPESIPVPIVYEDEFLLVVDKPAGLVVHPAPGHASGTLVNALLGRLGGLSSIGEPDRPGIVHRLDKDTSGLLVVAKHDPNAEPRHRGMSAFIVTTDMPGVTTGDIHGKLGVRAGSTGWVAMQASTMASVLIVVGQGDDFAAGARHHHDLGQFGPGVLAFHCPEPDLLAPGPNGAAVEVETGTSHGPGHLVKGNAVPPETFF